MNLLNYYRNLSSICPQKLRHFLYGSKSIKLQDEIYDFIQNHPDFGERPVMDQKTLSQFRLETHRRTKALFASKLMTYERIFDDIDNYIEFNTCVGMYDWSCLAKFVLSWQFVGLTLHLLGTDQHKRLREDVEAMNIFGSFAITELTHGSNFRAMQTTATFDPKTQQFILNTPCMEASKCWVGNLGSTATHCLVFAQLHTQNTCHGVHMFVVPIRNKETLLPLPGVLIGRMGSKLGLHGVDNGFMALKNVSIAKENLLNRFSDVTDDGTFISQFKDAEKRLSASLGALLMGRVAIVGISVANMRCALVIAIRFSCQRRQFYSTDFKLPGEETPVIEYPSQLIRLVPSFAKFFVYERFARQLFKYFHQSLKANVRGDLKESDHVLGKQLHVLSCGAKAVVTSCAQSVIQTCRETCGGHGFLSSSNLGKIREDNDPQLTYEGDNFVIIKQLVAYVIASFKNTGAVELFDFKIDQKEAAKVIQPIGSVDSLKDLNVAIRGLVLALLKYSRHTEHSRLDLARAVVNSVAFQTFLTWLETHDGSQEKEFLSLMAQLFAVQVLYENSAYLYSAGILQSSDLNRLQLRIEELCMTLKEDLASAVDAVAPPDFILNSSLGKSSGDLHHNILQELALQDHSRPSWWKEAVYRSETTAKL